MTAKERKKEAKFILGTAPPFTVLGKRRRNKLSVLLHGEVDSRLSGLSYYIQEGVLVCSRLLLRYVACTVQDVSNEFDFISWTSIRPKFWYRS